MTQDVRNFGDDFEALVLAHRELRADGTAERLRIALRRVREIAEEVGDMDAYA